MDKLFIQYISHSEKFALVAHALPYVSELTAVCAVPDIAPASQSVQPADGLLPDQRGTVREMLTDFCERKYAWKHSPYFAPGQTAVNMMLSEALTARETIVASCLSHSAPGSTCLETNTPSSPIITK